MKFYLLSCCLLVICIFSGCRKTESRPSQNDCKDKNSLSAGFQVTEYYQSEEAVWKIYSTDTVANNVLRFIADDSTATAYEWRIGAGIYHTRIVELEFPVEFLLQHTQISVSLSVTGPSISSCSVGTETSVGSLKTVTFMDTTLVSGTFIGHTQDKPDQPVTIRIDALKPCSEYNNGVFTTRNLYISNLVLGCETLIGTCVGGTSVLGYKQVYFNSDFCQSMAGTISIDSTGNNISINYGVFENGYQAEPVKHIFIGKRIL